MPRKSKVNLLLNNEPFAICPISVATLRAKPLYDAEIVSQMLFGELAHVIDRKGKNWLKIRCDWDDYIGWIDAKQLIRIPENIFNKSQEKQSYALEFVQAVMAAEYSIPICIGSTLPRFDGINFRLADEKMTYSGLAISSDEFEIDENRLVKLGLKYIHAPYLWGGRSPFGIDGSGLIQMIYKLAGVKIPRDTKDQVKLGVNVDFPSDAQAADLAFFDDTKGNICHVGMITEEKRILHAYGKVRIDYFDHHGIYNEDLGKYTHKLRIIKRPTLVRNSSSGKENLTLSI